MSKFLEFDEKTTKVVVNSFSKSSMALFGTCQLKAWRKKRSFESDTSRQLDVGKASHEYFAKEISRIRGKRYRANLFYAPDILRESKSYADKIDYDFLLKDSEIMDNEFKIEVTLSNQQSLVGIVDLALYTENEFLGDFIKIIDFKSGFRVSKEVDTEAMVYAFLAAKHYKMPVIFGRISGRSGDYWEQEFSEEEALSFEEYFVSYIENMKKVLESPEEPFPTVGAHCQSCPYLNKCVAKEYDNDNFDELIVQQALFEAKAKSMKNTIKNLAFENGFDIKTEHHTAAIKTKKMPKLTKDVRGKEKLVPKKELLKLLSETGNLSLVLDALDISLTSDVIKLAKELGLKEGSTLRKDVSVSKNQE